MREITTVKIEISSQGNVAVLSATGELDFNTCETLREAFQSLGEDSLRVVFDLREISFLDSEAIKVIVKCSRDVMEKEGKVAMVCGNVPRRVISLTGVGQLFPVCPDLETAVQYVTTSN